MSVRTIAIAIAVAAGLQGCAMESTTDPMRALPADTEFTVTEIAGAPVPEGVEVTIVREGAMVSGGAGCNRYSGLLGVEPGRLAPGPFAVTRMACPEPAMATETAFLAALESVDALRGRGSVVELLSAGEVAISARR